MRGLDPGLYLVSTPIGNLGDLAPRALDVLRAADLVACEDSRVTGKLLARFEVERSLVPYHEHNAARVRPRLLAALEAGGTVALASDAGTPCVADPGYKLVRAAIDAGRPVRAAPGPSAAIVALTISGLPTDRFLFAGFSPSKAGARRRFFAELAAISATLVIYEAPQRLAASLRDAADALGARDAAICRELTKLHEETARGSLAALAERYAAGPPPKGEIVLVIGPPERTEPDRGALDDALIAALAEASPAKAAARVARALGVDKATLYERAIALKRGRAE